MMTPTINSGVSNDSKSIVAPYVQPTQVSSSNVIGLRSEEETLAFAAGSERK